MKIIKIIILSSLALLTSCHNSSSSSSPIASSSSSPIASNINNDVSNNKDIEYLSNVRGYIVATYKGIQDPEALKKFNMQTYVNAIDDLDLTNAGQLNCKVLENTKPEEDKFDPSEMPEVVKDEKHTVAYMKVKEYLDSRFKTPSNDLDYISFSNSDQMVFLAYVPHLITESVVKYSVNYYCPEKKDKE
ncbi:MAG: hypothetical protein JO235_13790 [Chroococcidiopsidaceae cyanobacterium CP_BM_RX_35]|nr:hypothetical protein [Chroococcidiopsidaceae cyanobacterium CP_BM_RX_35]